MIDVAIVGLGAWGLCVLERTISRARLSRHPIRVHAIEPGVLGGAAYGPQQPDYLVLNNACGQLSLYADLSVQENMDFYSGIYGAGQRRYAWLQPEPVRVGQEPWLPLGGRRVPDWNGRRFDHPGRLPASPTHG